MRVRSLTWAAAAFVVAVGLASCSGGSDNKASSTTVPSGAGATAPTTSGGQPRAASAFCTSLRTFNERFGKINLGLADPQQFRTAMTEAGAAIKDAQGNAPETIKADVGTVSDGFQRLLTALQQANFDLSKLSLASLEQLQDPQFTGATQRLTTFIGQNCQ